MRKLVAISFFLVTSSLSIGQQTLSHTMNFTSGLQNMWGPSFNAFSINQTVNIFDVNWNESLSTGNGGIVNILGAQFGAALTGSFSGQIGCDFSLQGFTTGELEVEYPIDVTLDMPTDLTYDQGDDVTIQTDYVVDDPGYVLDTYYPNAGEAKLDLYFQMGAGLSATVCVFGCTTFPIIPNFNTGLQNINIFTVNSSNVSFFSFSGSPPLLSYNIFPLNTAMISGDPLGQFGLNGTLDLPYVQTTDNLNGKDIKAQGEYPYLNINLNIFKLLGKLPAPVGPILGNLEGSQSLLNIATINWNFFSASFDMNIANKQCFDFTPKVYGRFQFPAPVEFEIVDPIANTSTPRDTSSLITCEIGKDLLYKYPCYFSDVEIEPTYFIDGIITNHTYDSISFDLLMSAMEFSLVIPSVEITPSFTIPGFTLYYPYPCPSWSKPWRWCTGSVYIPPIFVPAVVSPAVNLSFGPLWSTAIPLGAIKYDWFNQTWSLEGFTEFTKPSFHMLASTLGASSVITDVDCFGGNNGAIDASFTAVSPALPYTYNWTNGATTEDLTNLAGGPYVLTAFDDNGCELVTGGTVIEPVQALNLSITTTDKSCNGGADDGTIDLFIQGGTAPYSVSWDNGTITEDLSGIGVGTYIATVTDSKGCTEQIIGQINQPNVLGQTAITTDINCNGGSDGAIDATAFGGTLPYAISWSSGQNVLDINNITAGTYTLTLTDAKGCQNVNTYPILEPAAALALSTTQVDVLCKGFATGSIDLTVNGGTPGYTFLWSNQMGVVIPFQSEDLTNIPAGNYSVSVLDFNNCTDTHDVQIIEPQDVILTNPILTDILCFGDATGVIDPVISGGTGPYAYNWSNGSTNAIASGLLSGNYTLTVTDNNGCNGDFAYSLTEPTDHQIVLNGVDVLCTGDLTGTISSTVSGGVSPYIYNWSSGHNIPNIQALSAGPYTLTVTDDNGCTESQLYNILEPAALVTSTFSVTTVNCFGDTTGAIDQTISGGTAPYDYLWSNGSSIVMSDTTEDISNLASDNYQLTVTDAHGCISNEVIPVTQPTADITINADITDVLCRGASTGSIDITAAGGNGGYTFSWTGGITTEDLTNVLAGSYTVTVTDALGCVKQATFNIDQPIQSLIVILSPTHVDCYSNATGYIESTVTGGVGPYQHLWSNGATSDSIFGLIAGNYSLTVTDANGCISFTGATILEPDTLVGIDSVLVTDVSCYGGNDGIINLAALGGTAPYSVDWGDPTQNLFSEENFIIENLTADQYFVRIIDANGCTKESWVTVNQPSLLESNYSTIDVLCAEDSTGQIDVTAQGGTPPYSILWQDGSSNFSLPNSPAGDYVYFVFDDNGCEDSSLVSIIEPGIMWYFSDIQELTCLIDDNGSIAVETVGGVEPYSYVWNTGSTDTIIRNLSEGDYYVIVTDLNGCYDSLSFTLYPPLDTCTNFANTFSPNGDGYNDTWIIQGIDNYPNAMVAIFNKWGNELYRTRGEYIPWDGTFNGTPLPSASYYYIIEYNDGLTESRSGVITIVR